MQLHSLSDYMSQSEFNHTIWTRLIHLLIKCKVIRTNATVALVPSSEFINSVNWLDDNKVKHAFTMPSKHWEYDTKVVPIMIYDEHAAITLKLSI